MTFAAGSSANDTQDIDIAVTDDDLSETAESFTVTLGTVGGDLSSQVSVKSTANSASATIAASDAITVGITGSTSVDEGDTTTNYTVSLSGGTPTADLTVSYATSDGTATAGSDYTGIEATTLTFTSADHADKTFTVQTTDDTVDEGTGETFTVSISSPSGGGGAAPTLGTATVTTTITDDDAAPTGITLSANPNSLGEDDAATGITITATMNGSTLPSDTVVTIGTLEGTATGGTGNDYTASTLASITIPANTESGTGTLTVTPIDDTVVEGDETIVVPGTTTTQVGLTVTSATITLTDDDKSTGDPGEEDDVDSAELSIAGPSANVAEGSDATFTVTLSAAVSKEVTVQWTATGNTDDYSPDSGTVTFAAGSSAGATQDIDIAVTNDDLSETVESFTVTLGTITSDLSSQVSLKSTANSASATIAASDAITVSLSGPTSVDEGDATSNYTVALSPSGVTPTSDLTVNYGTSNGTATAGSDYTAKSGTLTFTQTAAGSQTFTVQTTEDTVDEGTGETFTVSISGPAGGGGAAPTLGTSSVTTTITDDDAAPTGITLSADPNTLGEDDAATSVTVTATMNGSTLPTDTLVTIGTLSGTATSGTDYTATTLGNITINGSSSTGTGSFTVTPTDDEVVEGNETIVVPGTTTVTGLTVTSATITLTDDDKSTGDPGEEDDKDSAELSISGPASNVAEGSDATFTVTLSAAVAKEVQVAWSAPLAADAAESSDLSDTSGTVTFAANSAAGATQSITITATEDDLSETAESFTVTLGTITSDLSSQVSLKSESSSATATIAESDPITVNVTGDTSVDEGDDATYTVSLSGGTPTADLTVSYATADGTATAGSDYTGIATTTLTFTSADHADKTVDVETIDDMRAEAEEDFTFTISNPLGGGATPTLGTASVTTTIGASDPTSPPVDDNLPGAGGDVDVWITVSPDSVNEGDGEKDFTVTATHDAGTAQTGEVEIALTLGGTADSSDYTAYTAPASASVTIPANTMSGAMTLTLTMIDDDLSEGDETIFVGGHLAGSDVASGLITITDNDSPYLSITGPTADVTEGSNASFIVTLSKIVAADVTVAWSATAGTAQTSDYGTASGTVTFAANSAAGATQTFTIPVTDDNLSEGEETFTVTLGEDTGDKADEVWVKSTAASATATIAESDPITVSIDGPSNVDEGDATSDYTVSLSGGTPTANLTVNYATADGTATAGSDYTAKSGTLTFTSADHADKTFTVSTTVDTVDESDETFTVTISSPSGGGGATPTLGTSLVSTTITDDDAAPTGITLSASPDTLGEDDGKTSITVTATLNGGTTRTEATTVTIGTLSGTATKDTDYAVNTALASIIIPANTASETGALEITPTDDEVVEGDETIVVPGSTTVTGLTVTSAEITLTDDNKTTSTPTDDKDTAELSISGPTLNVSEGLDATFTVTLSAAVAAEVQVAWSAPLAADAAESSDLSATSGTVTFAANSAAGATQSITIGAEDDDLSEGAESFTVTLGAITSDLSSQVSLKSGSSSAGATIAASDPITIAISGPATVNEGNATSNYTVSLSGGAPTADLTVNYATADGGGSNDDAKGGEDYIAKSATLAFTSADHADKTFTVQTTDDMLAENSEDFTVSISSPSGGGHPTPSLGTSSSVTTTIGDNDELLKSPSLPHGLDIDIRLSVEPTSVNEGAGSTDFTVTATHEGDPHNEDVTIQLALAAASTATAGSTGDYTVDTALASLTIPANAASDSGTLTLIINDDDIVEGDETIIVGGNSGDLVIQSAVITINDDEATYLSITGPDSNVVEGDSATFTVTLSKAVSNAVTVAWNDAPGTAETSDYTPGSATMTFDAGSTAGATRNITIPVTDDSLSETTETFYVALGAVTADEADNVYVKTTASSAIATIAESDPITVNISGPSTVNEGDATSNYTVSLSPSGVTPTEDLTVAYAASGGTATSGTDYTATSGTLTFTSTAAGAQTFTIQTTEDTLDEGTGETFNVTLSNLSGGGGTSSLGTTTVSTTIRDDDGVRSVPVGHHLEHQRAVQRGRG